ncbi:hypothetical protein [Streptomyces sp. NPDC023838]|uniref:hypothetical protein n=1 Tax=Streptomyces sp. NPDC023838 TaxID=3154325 RepID=UPI0033E652F4
MRDIEAEARTADGFLTDQLMRCLDDLAETVGADDTFVAVVQEGLMSDTCGCHTYPPPGHTYPAPTTGEGE